MATKRLMDIFLILCILRVVDSDRVVSRPNYGLAYFPVGRLQFVTDKWLHIFRIELPTIPAQENFKSLNCNDDIKRNGPRSGWDPECVTQARHGQILTDACNISSYRKYANCMAKNAYSEVAHRLYKDFKEEYDHLQQNVKLTFTDFGSRPKRAWLDISGIFSKVFGFGRQKDMDSMNKAVQTLEKQYKDQSLAQQTVFKDMTSALDLTRTRMGHLSDRVTTLSQFTRQYVSAMMANTASHLQMSATRFHDIFTLSAELNHIALQIRRFDRGLATLMQGNLSPELVSFDLAKAVLEEVTTHLTRVRPQDRLAIKTAQEFYEIQDFYVQRQSNTLYLGLHLPVAHQGGRHILYRIESYPLPLDATANQVTYVTSPQKFLAQSDDGRYYFHPSTEELMTRCTMGHHKVCHYQPPLHDVSQDPSCEYAVFSNSKAISRDTCQYSVSSRPIKPEIVPLNSTMYLMLNVSEYTLSCQDNVETKVGCMTCVLILDHSCGCIIKYHSTILFPQHSRCKTTSTSSHVKYPKNLMVGKLLAASEDIQGIQGDTMDDFPSSFELPPLKIFDTEISKGVATDTKDALDLKQVFTNLQNDQTSYKHLADKLYHTQIQPMSTRLTFSPDYLPWLNLALTVLTNCFLLYLFCKFRILSAAITLQAAHTKAFEIKDNVFTDPPTNPPDWYQQIVVAPAPHTVTLMAIIALLLVTWCLHEVLIWGLNRIKWFRNFSLFWPRSAKWDIILQIAHKSHLTTVYLGPVPVLLTDFSYITQNAISRVKIATIVPGLLYKLSVVQNDRALLRKDDTLWHVPYNTYIGAITASKIRTALRHPPVRYRVLLGQDGIFRSPPLYLHTEIPTPLVIPTYVVETEAGSKNCRQNLLTPKMTPYTPPMPAKLKDTRAYPSTSSIADQQIRLLQPSAPSPTPTPPQRTKGKHKKTTRV